MWFRLSVILLTALAFAGPGPRVHAQPAPQAAPAPSPCEAQNVVIAGYALEMANLKIRIAEYERILKAHSSAPPAAPATPSAPAVTPAK